MGFVSQCPLVRGGRYSSVFTAHTSGTFFYHLHSGTERGHGLVIVSDGAETGLEDMPLVITDEYDVSDEALHAGWNGRPLAFPFPARVLMNGLAEQASLPVRQGRTYRVRVVNAASLCHFNVAFEGHVVSMVAFDGSPVEPVLRESIEISPGQRVDVVLSAAILRPKRRYAVRARCMWRGDRTGPGFTGVAAIEYAGVPEATPAIAGSSSSNATSSAALWVDPDLAPNDVLPWSFWPSLLTPTAEVTNAFGSVSGAPDKRFLLETVQQYVDPVTGEGKGVGPDASANQALRFAWTINNRRDILPATPWLLGAALGIPYSSEEAYGRGPRPLRVEPGDLVEVVVQNTCTQSGVCEMHPWHLHGHDFALVGQGAGAYDPVSGPKSFNLNNPPIMSTAVGYPTSFSRNLGGGASQQQSGPWKAPCGWFAIRFRAQIGSWPFHCHLSSHLAMGMGVVFDVAAERAGMPPPDAPFCGAALQKQLVGVGSKTPTPAPSAPAAVTPSPAPSSHASTNATAGEGAPYIPTRMYFPLVVFCGLVGATVVVIISQIRGKSKPTNIPLELPLAR